MPDAGATPPPARHGRDDVVAAALGILDRRGLSGMSMRAIADELGLQVSALYWHFPNKQALLAEISRRILARSAPDAPDIATAAEGFRDALLTFRDGAELVSSSFALGLVDPPVRRQIAEAALRAGADPVVAVAAADTIVHAIIGRVFHEQQRHGADALDAVAEPHGLRIDRMARGDDDVRIGIDLVVAGIAAAAARPGIIRSAETGASGG